MTLALQILAVLAALLIAGLALCALWARSGIGGDDMPAPCPPQQGCGNANHSQEDTQ